MRHDFLTATPLNPILLNKDLLEGPVAMISGEAAATPDSSDNDSARFIVILKAPPVAARLNEIQKDQALTSTQQEVIVDALTAELTAEQTTVLDMLQQQGLIQQIGRRFTYLVNGFVVTSRLGDRQAIAALPQVQAIYFNRQVHATLADSVPLIGAPAVWAMVDGSGNPVTGQSIKVAIIDTGIDYTHPDLGSCFGAGCKVIGGYDFVNNDSDPMDDHGHGTHVAGIVAGNGTIKGVAPEAMLLAYKALDASAGGEWDDVIAALEQAVLDQVDVINISLGGPGSPTDPLAQATNQAVDQGVAVIVAAGNNSDYRMIDSPGVAAKALTVGATDKSDWLVWFTSKGPVGSYLIKPDVVAPGQDINSSWLGQGYKPVDGTSMASPHVAGAVALLKQLHPDWTPGMFKASLMNTALPLGYDPFAEGAGRVQVGQAAITTVLIQPGSLSLGRVDDSQPTWTTAMPFEISNLANIAQSYQLSIDAGLPTGASAQLSSTSFTLNPGQTEVVSLSVTVDTNLLSYPIAQPYAYYGHIIIANGTEDRHVPFAFMPLPLDCETQDQIPTSECTALEALYNSTNGASWYWNGGWLDIPPCEWYHVTCDGGHVFGLFLPHNNLSGSIPPEVGSLAGLWGLTLSRNYLSGSIPPELGELANLEKLYLDTNHLIGSIPPEVGNLANLEELRLCTNHLSGSVPPELGDLVSLWGLFVDSNALGGEVPATITNLTKLTSTDFGYNKLTASDPAVVTFLNDKDPDWSETQTVPPTDVEATALSGSSVSLTWTPIAYVGDGGYYEISHATTSGGPYTIHGTTSDKSAANYLADDLSPNTTYYFVVRTHTPAHGNQQNDLLSDASQEVSTTTIVVNIADPSINDDGFCSLIEAIVNANDDAQTYADCPAGNGADTILLQASSPLYELTDVDNTTTDGDNGLPSIASEIIIRSNHVSANKSLIRRSQASGTPDFRIFHVADNGNLTLDKLIVNNGYGDDGGGILNHGTVKLIDSDILANEASNNGGGIFNDGGTVRLVEKSRIVGNSAGEGGGIFNSEYGWVELTDSTVSDNESAGGVIYGRGGGIFNDYDSVVELTNSTVSNNSANFSFGGGIFNRGVVDLTNSTVSGNTALGDGGGIFNSDGVVYLFNSTVSDNSTDFDGGGISNSDSDPYDNVDSVVFLINTIVAGNPSGGDCSGDPVTSLGHNLDSDDTCLLDESGDLTADPKLGPLGDNGGPPLTHALLPGSPAIDAGDDSACPATDQRGEPRPADGDGDGTATCDMGAYELQPPITLNIRAFIDGRSHLIVQRDTVHWHHLDYAAPGRLEGANEPTYLNGTAWFPIWPDVPNPENRGCDCDSSCFVGVPTLAVQAQTVALGIVQARGSVAIIQQPDQSNGFALIVEFNDNGPLGADWYGINLAYLEKPAAIDLTSFTAEAGADYVTLTWETGTEVDNAGFNLWRSEAADGPYTKINDALIPAEGDPVSGDSYVYTDTDVVKGVTYYYQLEDVDIHGVSTFHGPVLATPSPTHRIYLPLIFK